MNFTSMPHPYYSGNNNPYTTPAAFENPNNRSRGLFTGTSRLGLFNKIGHTAYSAINTTPEKTETPPSTSIKLLKFTSCCGGVIALGILIAGLALNIIGMIILGGIFTLNSAIGLFYSYKLGQLRSIDAYTLELNRLNKDLGTKNSQIQKMSDGMSRTEGDFIQLENQFRESLRQSDENQRSLTKQLEKTQRQLEKNIGSVINGNRKDHDQMLRDLEFFRTEDVKLREDLDQAHSEIARLQSYLNRNSRRGTRVS